MTIITLTAKATIAVIIYKCLYFPGIMKIALEILFLIISKLIKSD